MDKNPFNSALTEGFAPQGGGVTAAAELDAALFRTIFEQGAEALALVRGSDDTLVEVNREWEQLTGFSRSEALGRSALQLGLWTAALERERALGPLKAVGRVVDADVTLTMRNGAPRLVRLNANVLQSQGQSYVLLVLRDITDEQMAQEAQRSGERLLAEINARLRQQVALHALTETVARVGHWVLYPGETMVHVSSGYADIAGFGAISEVPIGEHAKSLFKADRALVKEALEAMDGRTIEYRWQRPDGKMIWIRSRLHRQVENGAVKAEFGIVQEITAQKEALAKLQESERRYKDLTELSSDWYWEQDDQFRFIRVDGNLENSRALPASVYLGKTRWDSDVAGVSPERWSAHRALLEAHEPFHDFEMQRQRVDGTLMWVTISGTPYFDEHGVFKGYRGTGSDITERKRAEADISRLAFFDALTGLPNRRLLMDRLAQALESSARRAMHGALLFIDLDNFKVLNDTSGHHMGDELLRQVAERLTQCVRSTDTVARLGGDEFVVMLEDIGEAAVGAVAQAEMVGRKILAAINQDFMLGGHKHRSSPSIGITLFFQHLHSLDELLKRADLAMYQSKNAGRNTMRFYDPAMQAAATDRAALEADMRLGLQLGEFELHYQPVVDARAQMTGVEALLRWHHPKRGMVSPAEFIPVAEQTGLILQLGEWVLQTACSQLVQWNDSAATRHLSIAVNVSARQFRHSEFTTQVLSLLQSSKANPHRLKMELTESLLLSDVDDAIRKMAELRSIGVSFALDDFGTGYSSLSYLKRLPLDQLKIDQSFVRDVLVDANDAAIARTILSLARNLDLEVVAEGVETEGQRDFLVAAGCKAFQGYLFGRPVPLGQLVMPAPGPLPGPLPGPSP